MSRIGAIIISLLLLMSLLNSIHGAAIAPSIVGYQGRLTDASDVPLTGTYSVTFRLYDAPTGGTMIWQETHSAVNVQNGLFTAVLGQGTTPVPLNETHFTQSNRWLAISIGAVEVSPRTQMTSVPFSTRVLTVDLARGGIISGQIELQADASKEGEAISAALIVRGTNLSRLVSINPDLEVALSATSNDGDEVFRVDALETGSSLKIKGAANNVVASINATPNGGDVSVAAVNGDVAAQLSSSPSGGTVAVFEPSAKGNRLSQKAWELSPEALVGFGSTSSESLIVMSEASADVGALLIRNLSAGSLSAVTLGGAVDQALQFTDQAGAVAARITANSISGTGRFSMEWPLSKAPCDGSTWVDYGNGNTFNCFTSGGDPAHAENAFVVGENNTVDSKNVFVLGQGNLIDDDGSDPNLNGDNSAVIGSNNVLKGDYSFCFGRNNDVRANGSASFGRLNYVDGGGNCFAFGDSNYVTATGNSSILGGNYNLLTWSPNSVIAGGFSQTLNLSGYSFIGAGYDNNIVGTDEPTDRYNVIGGGFSNDITSAGYATVAGGRENIASGDNSTVSGGFQNQTSGSGSSVAGGALNQASGNSSHVAGGVNNRAIGDYSLAAGGGSSARGVRSTAIGNKAVAIDDGSMVFSASPSTLIADSIKSGGSGQMVLRATGGIYITNASSEQAPYDVTKLINTSVAGCYLTAAGVWTSTSDKNAKENFQSVDGFEILEKLSQLPITEWNYKVDPDGVKHIGPMAQDFYKLFEVGYDDRSITTIDPSGVAFAAIQALYKKTEELKATTSKLKNQEDELARMKEQLAQMQAVLNKLAESKN